LRPIYSASMEAAKVLTENIHSREVGYVMVR
jgi:hypothetical protein